MSGKSPFTILYDYTYLIFTNVNFDIEVNIQIDWFDEGGGRMQLNLPVGTHDPTGRGKE